MKRIGSARRPIQRVVLVLLLLPIALAYQPAAEAEHDIDIRFHPIRGKVPPGPFTVRFEIHARCGPPVDARAQVGTSVIAGAASARALVGCGDITARVGYVHGSLHEFAEATYDEATGLYEATIPAKHMRAGRRIDYWLAAEFRRCDAEAWGWYFVYCGPAAGGSPSNCHWAEDRTRTYRMNVRGT